MIILNGVVQTPGTAFNVIDNLLVFAEPPQPPASVRYVTITFTPKSLTDLEFNNISGIFPNIGNVLVGSTTSSRFTELRLKVILLEVSTMILVVIMMDLLLKNL